MKYNPSKKIISLTKCLQHDNSVLTYKIVLQYSIVLKFIGEEVFRFKA